jgi:hypothetical protein
MIFTLFDGVLERVMSIQNIGYGFVNHERYFRCYDT